MTFPTPMIIPFDNQIIELYKGQSFLSFNSPNSSDWSRTMDIGNPAGGRRVFCLYAVNEGDNGDTPQVVNCSIGGIEATLHIEAREIDGGQTSVGIFSAVVPTGTSAEVAIELSEQADILRAVVISLKNLVNSSPTDTEGDGTTQNELTTSSLSWLADSYIMAVAMINDENIDKNWSGDLTEFADTPGGQSGTHSAAFDIPESNGNQSIELVTNDHNDRKALAALSWR